MLSWGEAKFFSMFIFLYGPDTFRSRLKLREITDAYAKKYSAGLSTASFDAHETSFSDFVHQVQAGSLFAKRQLFVVERMTENKEFLNAFSSFPQKSAWANDRNTFFVFWDEQNLTKTKRIATLLALASQKQEFEILTPRAFVSWCGRFAKAQAAAFEADALKLIAEWAGGDSWYAAQEIQKLHAYKKGKRVARQDVELLCVPPPQVYIFTTIDTLFNGDIKGGLRALGEHLRQGESPLYLLSMIGRQFRVLTLVKDIHEQGSSGSREGSPSAGIHPFVVRKSLPLARRLDWQTLKSLYAAFYRTEVGIKKGAFDPQLGLELLAIRVAKQCGK